MMGSGSRIAKIASFVRTDGPVNLHDSLRKRATTRIVERIDLTKVRHKPLSLLRQEAKRIVEQFLDVEAPTLPRAEREQIAEEALSDVLGFGPLDELFQDEKINEFMVLAHDQVIRRDEESWLPVNTKFRDKDQYRSLLEKIVAQGEPVVSNMEGLKMPTTAAFDVKLLNGFRVLGVLPPTVLDHPPLAVFTRVSRPAKVSSPSMAKAIPSPLPAANSAARPSPLPTKTLTQTPLGLGKPAPRPAPSPAKKSNAVDFDMPVVDDLEAEQTAMTMRMLDPVEHCRATILDKLRKKLALAGVTDVRVIPMNELTRVVAMYVQEFDAEEQIGLEKADQERLTLEILVAIKRP